MDEIPEDATYGVSKDGHKSFSATGVELPDKEGLKVELEGTWESGKYGLQLKVERYRELRPTGREELVAYLSSGSLKGIEIVLANRIVARFGEKTLDVLDNDPERLVEVKGISKKMIPDVISSYNRSHQFRELVMALSPFGISNGAIKKIQNHFGINSVKVVKNNPFRLCEISSIGFSMADRIAKAGDRYKPDDKMRIKAGILTVLKKGESNGHLFLPSDVIVKAAWKLLNDKMPRNAVSEGQIKEAGNELVFLDELLVAEGRYLYRAKYYDAEVGMAENVCRIMRGALRQANVDKELREVQRHMKVQAAEKQLEAVKTAFLHPISIVTGRPGMGKTFVIKLILEVHKTIYKNSNVLLCAPTGRASRVMAEKSGYPAITIHKATNTSGEEEEDEEAIAIDGEVMEADLIIVDEASMVDMSLAAKLFNQIKTGARVVLVGDVEQLPSVGPGNVFKELIHSGVIPTTVLDVIFRQEEGSLIVENSNKIVEGETNLTYGDGFQILYATTDEKAAKIIEDLYLDKLEEAGGDCDKVQVLTPFRKDTKAGANALNVVLENSVNPTGKAVGIGTSKFKIGDKVMQTKNKEDVSNGDMGYIVETDGKEIMVNFGDGRLGSYTGEDLNLLSLSYATTIHKAQGDEYPIVILPMLMCHKPLLRRKLIYTAVTRAKSQVYIVGSQDAVNLAIRTNGDDGRNTLLASKIKKMFGECKKQKHSS